MDYYFHEGLDYGHGKDTEIRSLIQGQVMMVGTHRAKKTLTKEEHKNNLNLQSMGDFMIVQDGKDPYKYYLLVHLAWESWNDFGIKPGMTISPQQSVAKIGCADIDEKKGGGNYHFHVSVVRSENFKNGENKYKPIDFPDGDIIDKDYVFPVWKDINRKYMLNPLDNSQTWGGRL
jgi:hypothetical protein